MCIEEGCSKRASFNKEGETKGLYCSGHKKDDMINVVSRKCMEEGCIKQPSFNKEGETKGLYCFEHKEEGMVDVVSKHCIEEGCITRPNYNKEGETKGLYCSDHKKEGMIDVIHKHCIEEGCTKIPNFNKEGETIRLYCSGHKKEGMVDVIHKHCIEEGCIKQPSFNNEGETIRLYCSGHKKEGMVDVMSKRCIEEGCTTQANFNNEGETKGLYCLIHKKEGMVDVKHKKCIECELTRANSKYEGHCIRCFINLFPDKPVSRNYKIKENHIFEEIIKLLPKDTDFIRDKQVGGCSKRRPDLMIDLGSHWICAENDENCHKDYDNSCENRRTMELYQDMGNRPMVLIRFNCDKYSGHKSLFKVCKQTGISIINSKKEFKERTKKFAETIIKYINEEPPEKAITPEYLYYDN